MSVTAFDTDNYDASTNPDGTKLQVSVNGVDTEVLSGGAAIANVAPLTNLKMRVYKVPAPSAPGNSLKGALPDVQRMRWTISSNTGANTAGGTVVADAGRQIDTQFFKLEKCAVSDDSVVEVIPCTATQVNAVGALPAYTDITFNPVPSGSSANELDRDTSFYYKTTLVPNLPYAEYTDSESV